MEIQTINFGEILDYFWILYAMFLCLVVLVSLALLYNWEKYAQIKKAKFIIAQSTYFLGIAFLFFLSLVFFINI